MSTTDEAARIRSEYKRRGWDSRKISVKSKYYSMGSSITVRVNDPDISLKLVQEIAEQAESIRRDGYGEILSGGNRYVHVDHSSDAEKALTARWINAVDAALDKVASDSNLQPIEGTPFLIGRKNEWTITLWGRESGMISEPSNAAWAAYSVGKRMVDEQAAQVTA